MADPEGFIKRNEQRLVLGAFFLILVLMLVPTAIITFGGTPAVVLLVLGVIAFLTGCAWGFLSGYFGARRDEQSVLRSVGRGFREAWSFIWWFSP